LFPRSKTKREKSTTTKGHYVRNADLLPAVIEAKELGVVTDKLIKMIWLIAERYSRKANFIGYSFREDMVSIAVENLCKNALKFNHEKYSNPFAFYTTAIHNSFLQFMADEKKHRNIRDALLIDAGANPSFNFMQGEKDEAQLEIQESDEFYVPEKEDGAGEEEERPTAERVPLVPREEKIRYRDRIPSAVKRYGPGDIEIDPVTGAITIKVKEPVVETPVAEKKTRKPRVPKPVEEVKVARKPRTVKKDVEKKPAAKKVAKKDVAEKKTKTKTKTKTTKAK
jgi:hypothetical protein